MSKLVSITPAAKALGVSATTLRRWEASGSLVPTRTATGQRRYDLTALLPEQLSARLYSSRSHKNRKLIDSVRKAVQEAQC